MFRRRRRRAGARDRRRQPLKRPLRVGTAPRLCCCDPPRRLRERSSRRLSSRRPPSHRDTRLLLPSCLFCRLVSRSCLLPSPGLLIELSVRYLRAVSRSPPPPLGSPSPVSLSSCITFTTAALRGPHARSTTSFARSTARCERGTLQALELSCLQTRSGPR